MGKGDPLDRTKSCIVHQLTFVSTLTTGFADEFDLLSLLIAAGGSRGCEGERHGLAGLVGLGDGGGVLLLPLLLRLPSDRCAVVDLVHGRRHRILTHVPAIHSTFLQV